MPTREEKELKLLRAHATRLGADLSSAAYLLVEPSRTGGLDEFDSDAWNSLDLQSTTQISRKALERPTRSLHPQATIRRVPDSSEGVIAGRAEECGLLFNEQGVSKQHARFVKDASGWSLEDLNSTNGTFVDGEQLEAGGKRALRDGARLQLGDQTRFRFLLQLSLEDVLSMDS
jgi:pSer/pThr/pTyr-binding forkhead associated (FHA) protein